MRYEIIMLLSWLVQEGYIASFHVTKGKIYVTIKQCGENGAKVRPSKNILSSSSLKNAALVSQKN